MSERRLRRDREQGARRELKRRQRRRRLGLSAGAALGAAAFVAPAADAATYTVTNTSDDAVTPPAGSLRAAIEAANATDGVPDDIVFQAGVTGQITLDAEELIITDAVTIQGPGARALTVSGDDSSRVFDIFIPGGDFRGSAAGATISGLTISDGYVVNAAGAGIEAVDSSLTLIDVEVSGNTAADDGDFALGGGISVVASNLTVRNSTISGNTVESAQLGRGGVTYSGYGGGIAVSGLSDAQISNSTISGNVAEYGGGMVVNQANTNVNISNSTISDNYGSEAGGGIYRKYDPGIDIRGTAGGSDTNLLSTIVAGNRNETPGQADDLYEDGSTPDSRYNAAFSLIGGTAAGATVNETGPNIFGQAPLLGALGNNGGPTDTHLPGATSPAADKGTANGFTSDQRGLARVQDNPSVGNQTGGDGTDIGAVELQLATPETPGRPSCAGEEATIVGTNGKDVITGTAGVDVIKALRGNDTIKSLGGDDIVCGDAGRDKISSGGGDDLAKGGNAGDRIKGGNGDDVLRGGAGFDRLLGGAGNDQLFGGAKNAKRAVNPNSCDGGSGNDTASGCDPADNVP